MGIVTPSPTARPPHHVQTRPVLGTPAGGGSYAFGCSNLSGCWEVDDRNPKQRARAAAGAQLLACIVCYAVAVATPSREFKFKVGNYRAEIRESQSGTRVWYVIVHRCDSGDLAAIEQFETYDQAREAVTTTLSRIQSGEES